MTEIIEDGSGSGRKLKIDENNMAHVYAYSASIQHIASERDQDAYQVWGVANLANGTVVPLHIFNNDPSKNLVVTYVRHQIIGASGGTSFPNSSNYFAPAFKRAYSSGGSIVTPVNMFAGAGNTAKITCYQGTPVLSGSADVFDRWYTKADGDMNTYNKEGALIVPPNKTFEIAYVGDHTSGICFARVSFVMEEHI